MCRIVLFLVFASYAGVVDAVARGSLAISPTLKPKSDRSFFGKDYPRDTRPKVDVLHFKHPYPVVQDSDEFDKDFVKDENSDNGLWQAQTEYDRLRHKLAKEKADVARALAATQRADAELKESIARERHAQEKKRSDEKKREHRPAEPTEEIEKKKEQHKRAREPEAADKQESNDKDNRNDNDHDHKHRPEHDRTPDDAGARKGAEKAMDALEACKKQLAEARDKLKRLMTELDEAKRRQRETQAALDAAVEHEKALQAGQKPLDEAVEKEHHEYLDAREAFLKQQASVAKMEHDLEAAAEKIKALRDAEDRNGGVYNTPQHSSAPFSAVPACSFIIALFIQLA